MRRFGDSNQSSLFASTFCDSDKRAPDFIAADEKAFVRERCPGDNRGIVDCHSANLEEYIADAGGLDFANKPIVTSSPAIPDDLVVVPPECFDWEPERFPEIVGINLKDILSPKPRLRWGYYHIRDGVRISLSALDRPAFRGKKVVLFSSCLDVAIEKLWFEKHDISLFQEIAKGNFHAVAGMNFSLFLHECPMGQLINLNKSLRFAHELSKLGVPVIPHIYAVNDNQRKKLIEYIRVNPSINAVVINTQLQKDPYSIAEAVKTVDVVMDNTHSKVILHGRKLKIPTNYQGRIIEVNQDGLKQQAIIENARERQMARQMLAETEQQPLLQFKKAKPI
jgi:hypothetical protein